MSNSAITPNAVEYIVKKSARSKISSQKRSGSIPRLKFARKVTWSDKSGHKTELGPRFFFDWSSMDQALKEGDFFAEAPGIGKIALAPGKLFANGSHRVDLIGDYLTLVPPL